MLIALINLIRERIDNFPSRHSNFNLAIVPVAIAILDLISFVDLQSFVIVAPSHIYTWCTRLWHQARYRWCSRLNVFSDEDGEPD